MNRLTMMAAVTVGLAAAGDVPGWLTAAAALDAKAVAGSAPAVDLWRDVVVTVQEDGRQRTVERRAVRILSAAGRPHAVGRVVYEANTAKVKSLNGWLFGTDGAVMNLGRRETVDVALAGEDFYNEIRVRAVVAPRAEPGLVFGWEAEVEREPLFGDVVEEMQGTLPLVKSRLTVVTPAGWTWKVRAVNVPEAGGKQEGNQVTWEIANRAALEEEPMGPSPRSAAPRIAVGLQPPAGSAAPRAFDGWNEVGNWLRSVSEAQVEPSAEIRTKAAELVAGKNGEMERIGAIGRFVQGIRYVSIQTGVGRGGGYRPHAAAEVMTRLRGDCKDKATLMRSLLRAAGIGSRIVVISTEDGYVKEDWPTPQQFNHAIVAVAVSAGVKAEAVVESAASGRVLLFDPTDPATPPGRLPRVEQDNLALIVTEPGGALVRTRASGPEANRVEKKAEYVLTALGDLKAKLVEERRGDTGASMLALNEAGGTEKVKEAARGYLSRSGPGVTVGSMEVGMGPEGDWRMEAEFQAPAFAKILPRRLLVFRLPEFGDGAAGLEKGRERKFPVRLAGRTAATWSTVTAPPGFAVDEMPDPVTQETEFGRFSACWKEEGGRLRFESHLEISTRTLAAERAGEVADFLNKFREAMRAPVVLLQK